MKASLQVLISVFIIYCSCKGALKKEGKEQPTLLPIATEKEKKIATLVNTSGKNISFHYIDKFNLINQVTIDPQQAYNFEFDSVGYLTQSNQFQNIYKIDRKDTLRISLNSKGNMIAMDMPNKQAQNEFDLFRYINENSKYSFMQFNNLSYKMHSYNYTVVDSLYKWRFEEQIASLNKYCKENKVSDKFRDFAQDYFRSSLLGNLFSIPVSNKSKIPVSYFAYLNSFETEVIEKTNKVTEFLSENLFYSFLRFKILKLNKEKKLNRSFIDQIDKTNINETARQRQKVYIIGNMLAVGKQIDTSMLVQFVKDYPGTGYSNYYETILSDINTMKTAGDNQLLQVDGKKIEYTDVLKSLKGKVVFIDVWASWCLPCRKQFQNSKKLQEYFSGKEVEFLYISIDNSSAAWKKACTEEGIFQKKLNYLLPDHDNSSFVKNLKISTIPRYVVIGKDGKIFNSTLAEEINEDTKNIILRALK